MLEHDLRGAGDCGREGTVDIVTRNFYSTNAQRHIRKYGNECFICHWTKALRHQELGFVHLLAVALKIWIYIRTVFITNRPESGGATTILVVVDPFTKMAYFIPFKKKN